MNAPTDERVLEATNQGGRGVNKSPLMPSWDGRHPVASVTSYGLFGDVQAKRKGAEDFFKYYTRTYGFPVRMHKPYLNADCLKCHERTPKFVDSETHGENLAEIRQGDLRCIDCHGPAHAEQAAP